MQELIIPLLLSIVDIFASLRLGVNYIVLESPCFSLLHPLLFPYTSYLNHLLYSWLSSWTVHSALYAINWIHKLEDFEDVNPCDKFLVQSIAQASSSIPCRPVRKAEPITAEIIGLILKLYGPGQ